MHRLINNVYLKSMAEYLKVEIPERIFSRDFRDDLF